MPPRDIEITYGRPSYISDVLRQVRDAFDAIGDATTIQVGYRFREQFGAGSGPKVVFVPEFGGSVGDPIDQGNAASMSHGCDIFIRADIETGDDYSRHDAACELSDLVIDLVGSAAPGRITWGTCTDDSPVRTDTGMGAGLALHFEYRRQIRHNAKRWAAEILTAAGAHPSRLALTPDSTPPVLASDPAAVYADAADVPVTVSPIL